jgi:hypothetical protein
MGDRAYAQVLCRAKDVAAFEELGFGGTGVLEGATGGRVRSWSRRKRITATPLPSESWRREGTSSSPNTMREASMTQAGL